MKKYYSYALRYQFFTLLSLVIVFLFSPKISWTQEDPRLIAEQHKREQIQLQQTQVLMDDISQKLTEIQQIIRNPDKREQAEILWQHWLPKLELLCPNIPHKGISSAKLEELEPWITNHGDTEVDHYIVMLQSLITNL
jgi:hypothetical protein